MRTVLLSIFAALVAGAGVLFALDRLDLVDLDRVRDAFEERRRDLAEHVPVPRVFDRTPEAARVIYLNREGALLRGGGEDSRRNRSHLAGPAASDAVDIPAFASTQARWDAIVGCVRAKFEPFAVEVVDRRPVEGRYVMAVIGGRPDALRARREEHRGRERVTGLAPFNGQPIEDAVVLVFSRALAEDVTAVCETAAMEIGHAYGLDHSLHCRDLMTYLRRCGRRLFLDREVPCGEQAKRACADGQPAQNSFARLADALGRRETGRSAR